MKYLMIALLVTFFSTAVNAEPIGFTYTLSEVTHRTDDEPVTGAVTYKIFGGNPGGPYTELLETPTLTGNGTVDLIKREAEFYATACEDGDCGGQSAMSSVGCMPGVIGFTSLSITLNCN